MKPNFIGIGGQRCATTWIFDCLKEHPEVCNIEKKEINFFTHYYNRGYEWYERYFKGCSGYKAIGEFSTSYLYDYNAPKRIYNYNPDAKIIVCLRNPIERAYSQHKHHIRLGFVTGINLSFDKAVKDNPMYIEQGLYYTHLKRWINYFQIGNNLLVLIYEDMLKNPLTFIQSVYDFLQINPNFIPSNLNKEINKAIIPKNFKLHRLINKASLTFRAIGMGYFIEFIKFVGIKRAIEYLNSEKRLNVYNMSDETRKNLQELFYEENKKLSNLLDRDLSFWT